MKKLIAVTLLAMTAAAHAQGVAVQGPGTISCGRYIELRATNSPIQDGAVVSWAWGYMAGFNLESKFPTTAPLPDQPSTLNYIDKHCRDNPLDSVLMATAALVQALGGRRNPR